MCIYVYVYTYIHIYICVCVCVFMCVFICIHTYTHSYVCMCACIYICMQIIHTYTLTYSTHIYIHTHTHTNTCHRFRGLAIFAPDHVPYVPANTNGSVPSRQPSSSSSSSWLENIHKQHELERKEREANSSRLVSLRRRLTAFFSKHNADVIEQADALAR